MIQEAQAKQLLEETFARMNPGEAMEPGRKKYAELRVRRAERRVSCTGNLYQKAREALTEQETVLEEEPDSRLLLSTGSGLGRQNPAVVELEFDADSVTLTAWAKEGLIPQRTAHLGRRADRGGGEFPTTRRGGHAPQSRCPCLLYTSRCV